MYVYTPSVVLKIDIDERLIVSDVVCNPFENCLAQFCDFNKRPGNQ